MRRTMAREISKSIDRKLKYIDIKNDPDAFANSTYFGKDSIIMAFCNAMLSILSILAFDWAIQQKHYMIIFTIVIFLAVAIIFFMSVMFLGIRGVVSAIRQLTLQRKATGFIGLLLNIIAYISIFFMLASVMSNV